MEHRAAEYAALDLGLVVVSQGRPAVLAQFLEQYPKPYPVVGDPDRALYRAVGLDRVTWRSFAKPRVVLAYLKEMWHGAKLRAPYAGEDVLQRGGDFVVDCAGTELFAHRSPDSTSRPAVASILEVVEVTRSRSSPPR